MPRIVRRERLVPNIHLLEVEAPEIARKCRAGQFVIVMPDARGERIPLTIADWDRDRGTVVCIFMAVGTTTRKLALLRGGDDIPIFAGPLGLPSEIRPFGTVLCAGGCFGIAAIHPLVRALKEAGNRVLVLVDVKAGYLLYWEDKLRALADEFIVSSRDGAYPSTDYVPRRIREVLERERVDRIHAVGCTYLMSSIAEATRPSGVKTVVSLNPIMVDGTGMCGACRLTVDGKTKFACVDGPDFDGHLV
ncbi:MAG: sulfide/dihydroorotate dehydrogenase-like FAD/NAD-binding protein, partial [Acidobacteria bacterium]|nr:sulfide/dihydroorotate dehydrogenase-like FAD/NAD-binding protein [Acidobacteriota bacterium]